MVGRAEPKRLRLTPLGELAARYGVQTPASWWARQLKDIERVADIDGDWEQMIHERIQGLMELRRTVAERGTDWYRP